MTNETISESSVTASINAPIERVNVADWLFNLPDAEYQRCSPAHIAAGTTRAEDGKRMFINVEIICGSIVVQHYVEDVAEKHRVRLISLSDTFSPNGHAKVQVIWELSVRPIDDRSCEFINRLHGTARDEFHTFLERHGLPFALEAHNRVETPLFAKSIERKALRTHFRDDMQGGTVPR